MRASFRGDTEATVEKAAGMLAVARAELREVKKLKDQTTPTARARLREAANKAWLALSTGADAYLCATQGEAAKRTKQVIGVYKHLGSEAAGQANLVYNDLHINCGYEDRPTCTVDYVGIGFRHAGEALATLSKRLAAARKQGKAKKRCEPIVAI